MSLKRPNSLLIRARNPPSTPIQLMEELVTEHLSDHVKCVQQGKRYEWIVSFSDSAFVERAEFVFTEDQGRDFIAQKLKVNEKSKCTLAGVPFEFSNANIMAQLTQYFEDLSIEMETYRNTPEGMMDIYTGNRILNYKSLKKPPPNKISLGRGISGWINNVESKNLADYTVTCRKCGQTGHLALECMEEPRCTKCTERGHETKDCEEENCKNCHSRFHVTWICPREGSARSRGGRWADRLANVGEATEENSTNDDLTRNGITEEEQPSFIEVEVSPLVGKKDSNEENNNVQGEEDKNKSIIEEEDKDGDAKRNENDDETEKDAKRNENDDETEKEEEDKTKDVRENKDGKDQEGRANEEKENTVREVVTELEATQTKRLKNQLATKMREAEESGLKMVLERNEEGDSWSVGSGIAWSEASETPSATKQKGRPGLRGKGGRDSGTKKKSPIQKLGEKIREKIGGERTPSQRRRNRSEDQEIGRNEKKLKK